MDGPSESKRASASTAKPRARAAVHTTGSVSCSPLMPPHARMKSPSPGSFSSGGAGEWSLDTTSSTPSRSPSHSRSRFSSSRIGGAHLKRVSPAGTSSAAKVR